MPMTEADLAEMMREIHGDDHMRPQPDMAQMPFEYEPMTWRDHALCVIQLLAAIAGGLGIFAVIMAAQMMAGG